MNSHEATERVYTGYLVARNECILSADPAVGTFGSYFTLFNTGLYAQDLEFLQSAM